MRTLYLIAFILVFALFSSAQPQNVDVQDRSPEQGAPALEIVKAHASTSESSNSERARTFTVVVKNTGGQEIESLRFEFELLDGDGSPDQNEPQRTLRCGFVTASLHIQPDEEFTIERTLTGNHCIPERSVLQAVRVLEIHYHDGTRWAHLAEDEFGWKRVKLQKTSLDSREQ